MTMNDILILLFFVLFFAAFAWWMVTLDKYTQY